MSLLGRAFFKTGLVLIGLVILIGIYTGLESLLSEEWMAAVGAVFGIALLASPFLAYHLIYINTAEVAVLYYCKQCHYTLKMTDKVVYKTRKVIPDELRTLVDCPYCHKPPETLSITWDEAMYIGWITKCEACGHQQLKLGAHVGDRCSSCGAVFSRTTIERI
jgi:hypothetical protein